MSEVVVDTSVIVDHLRNIPKATALIEKIKEGSMVGYISVLTEAELFAGKDSGDQEKRTSLIELLSLFNKVEMTEGLARVAGDFRRKYGVPLSDAIIAATAFMVRCKVVTQNLKDFDRISEIRVEKPY
ncbi:MAG: type II toxin-antitoxin system VapC family toxin [Candidatus Micrarchaeota archaeon]|nr:type II toxin-antitoxin system VapC family toxin [Candidatus Micrarchaeota archaeon]